MKLRIARATNDLARISKMYCDGLELEVLGSFVGHNGFDGIMLGTPGGEYHFEFTLEEAVAAPTSHSKESLLVFYVASEYEFTNVCLRMLSSGFNQVVSHNPYWDENGSTFEDFENYRVVICQQDWKK